MIYKVISGKIKRVAGNQVLDHNELSNRDAYGAHPISAIRKLPEKLSELKKSINTQRSRIDSLIPEVNKKLDKVDELPQLGTYVYSVSKDESGEVTQSLLESLSTPVPNKIALFTSNSTIKTSTPIDANDAVNKSYAENNIAVQIEYVGFEGE